MKFNNGTNYQKSDTFLFAGCAKTVARQSQNGLSGFNLDSMI